MVRFDKNEKKYVWIKITERDDSTVTLSSYVFQVYDVDGTSVQAQAAASISGNGTATVKLYGLVDTSTDSFTAGEAYEVKFTYVIGSETYISTVGIKLVETAI